MVTQVQLAFFFFSLLYIWLWGKHSLLCTAETGVKVEGSSFVVPVLLLLLLLPSSHTFVNVCGILLLSINGLNTCA